MSNISPYAAVHNSGSNYFDRVSIDINATHKIPLPSLTQKLRHRPPVVNRARLLLVVILMRLNIFPLLVTSGLLNGWYIDFCYYWTNILQCRPLWSTTEFFSLLHDYRKASISSSSYVWSDLGQHIANWQRPEKIYLTFHYARKLALRPIIHASFWKYLKNSSSVLEFGCSLAPYYYCYKTFFNDKICAWNLADIPNYPFHYAKYKYRNDPVLFFTIFSAQDAHGVFAGKLYDCIICVEVFEHLDNPLEVAKNMISSLKQNGILVFDYIESDATELDHPIALRDRKVTLDYIFENTSLIEGTITDSYRDLRRCIVQKTDTII